jgi:hypothetical protein
MIEHFILTGKKAKCICSHCGKLVLVLQKIPSLTKIERDHNHFNVNSQRVALSGSIAPYQHS